MIFHGHIKTFEEINTRLKSGKRFVFTRFGDGELLCMDNPMFANKRHQPKDDLLSQDLNKAFSVYHPDYMVGCVKKSKLDEHTRTIRKIIEKSNHENLYSATLFHTIFIRNPEIFRTLIRNLKNRNVIAVGGSSLSNLNVMKMFNIKSVFHTGDTNAYYDLMIAVNNICNIIPDGSVVLPAMGWASNILSYILWNMNMNVQVIDIGSTIDAVAGRNTRSWIKQNKERINECLKYLS